MEADVEAGLPIPRPATRDGPTGVGVREYFVSTLLYVAAIQLIYEYYLTFNSFVLVLRALQWVALDRYKELKPPVQRAKKTATFTALLLIEFPIFLLKVLYQPQTSLLIIFVGKASPAGFLPSLAIECIILSIYFVLYHQLGS